jgi:DNA repair protein SbcD/Mre11
MTFRFAHLADLHVGAWRERALAETGLAAVRAAFERCIEERVDFIVIAGDLFDATLPDMAHVRETAEVLRRVREAGIPVYATYGSHDYSPSATSVIDVLEASGLFVKLMATDPVGDGDEALIRPRFFVDPGTGAKLAGLSGRQRSLERECYRRLDHAYLEAEPGFKVFVFHSALDEVLPEHERHAESMPRSFLPPGFDYYAGGHIHTRIETRVPGGRGVLAYPGPLLGHQYGDLERARDTLRGFFIVTADETVTDLSFVEVPLPPVVLHDLPAEGRTSGEVARALEEAVTAGPHDGAIVLVRARGRLAAGDPREIPFAAAREALDAQGALCVKLSRSGLAGPARHRGRIDGAGGKHEIEARVIAERCAAFHPDPALDDEVRARVAAVFEADAGAETGRRVLEAIAVEPAESEAVRAFANRVRERVGAALPGLEEER